VTNVLLVFSLLLHLVTFYIIMILAQRIQQIKNQTGGIENRELAEILESHLEAVRAENQRLIAQLTPLDHHNISDSGPKDGEKAAIEKKAQPLDHEIPPPPVEGIEDQVEPSQTGEVIQLYQKGWSKQEIAKHLGLGNGEVELIINLYNKSNRK